MPEILTNVNAQLANSSFVERNIPRLSEQRGAKSALENLTIYAVPDIIGAAVESIRDPRGPNGGYSPYWNAAGDVLASIIEHGLSRIDKDPERQDRKVPGKWNVEGRREAEIDKDAQERMLRVLDALHSARNAEMFSLPTSLMFKLVDVVTRGKDPFGCDIKAIECLGRSMDASPTLTRLLGDPNESEARRLACAQALSNSSETFVKGRRAEILQDPRSKISNRLAERIIDSMRNNDFEERSALVIFAANQVDNPRLQLTALEKLHNQDRLETDRELSAVARILNDPKTPHAACRAAVAAVQEGVVHEGHVRSFVDYASATTDLELKARITRKLVGNQSKAALQYFASIVDDSLADLYSVHAALQGIRECPDPTGLAQQALKNRATKVIQEDGPQAFQFDIKVMAYEALAVGSREWVISRLDDPESSAQDLVGAIMVLAKLPLNEQIHEFGGLLLHKIPEARLAGENIPRGSEHACKFPDSVQLAVCLNSIVLKELRPYVKDLSPTDREDILKMGSFESVYPRTLGFEVLGRASQKNRERELGWVMDIVELEPKNWLNWGVGRYRKDCPKWLRSAALQFLINSQGAPLELLFKSPEPEHRLLMLRSLDPQIHSVAKIIERVAKKDPAEAVRQEARRILAAVDGGQVVHPKK